MAIRYFFLLLVQGLAVTSLHAFTPAQDDLEERLIQLVIAYYERQVERLDCMDLEALQTIMAMEDTDSADCLKQMGDRMRLGIEPGGIDLEKAIAYYEAAMFLGNQQAQFELAVILTESEDYNTRQEGWHLLKKVEHLPSFTRIHGKKRLNRANPEKAYTLYLGGFQAGDVEAALPLALLHARYHFDLGERHSIPDEKAGYWSPRREQAFLEIAFAHGMPRAALRLAKLVEPFNPGLARELWTIGQEALEPGYRRPDDYQTVLDVVQDGPKGFPLLDFPYLVSSGSMSLQAPKIIPLPKVASIRVMDGGRTILARLEDPEHTLVILDAEQGVVRHRLTIGEDFLYTGGGCHVLVYLSRENSLRCYDVGSGELLGETPNPFPNRISNIYMGEYVGEAALVASRVSTEYLQVDALQLPHISPRALGRETIWLREDDDLDPNTPGLGPDWEVLGLPANRDRKHYSQYTAPATDLDLRVEVTEDFDFQILDSGDGRLLATLEDVFPKGRHPIRRRKSTYFNGHIMITAVKGGEIRIQPLNLREAMTREGSHAVVTRPPRFFRPGERWHYQPEIYPDAEGTRLHLTKGPPGMTLVDGVLEWRPPLETRDDVTVALDLVTEKGLVITKTMILKAQVAHLTYRSSHPWDTNLSPANVWPDPNSGPAVIHTRSQRPLGTTHVPRPSSRERVNIKQPLTFPLEGKLEKGLVAGYGRYLVFKQKSEYNQPRNQVLILDLLARAWLPPIAVQTHQFQLAAGGHRIAIYIPSRKRLLTYRVGTALPEAIVSIDLPKKVNFFMGSLEPDRLALSDRDFLSLIDPTSGELLLKVRHFSATVCDPHGRIFADRSNLGYLNADGSMTLINEHGLGYEVQPTGWGRVWGSRGYLQLDYRQDKPKLKTLNKRRGIFPPSSSPLFLRSGLHDHGPKTRSWKLTLFDNLTNSELGTVLQTTLPKGVEPDYVAFVPASGYVAYHVGDELRVHPFDIEKPVSQPAPGLLVMVRVPRQDYLPDRPYRERVVAVAATGRPEYKLINGPPGMKLSRRGVLTWKPDGGVHQVEISIGKIKSTEFKRSFTIYPADGSLPDWSYRPRL